MFTVLNLIDVFLLQFAYFLVCMAWPSWILVPMKTRNVYFSYVSVCVFWSSFVRVCVFSVKGFFSPSALFIISRCVILFKTFCERGNSRILEFFSPFCDHVVPWHFTHLLFSFPPTWSKIPSLKKFDFNHQIWWCSISIFDELTFLFVSVTFSGIPLFRRCLVIDYRTIVFYISELLYSFVRVKIRVTLRLSKQIHSQSSPRKDISLILLPCIWNYPVTQDQGHSNPVPSTPSRQGLIDFYPIIIRCACRSEESRYRFIVFDWR